MKKAKVILVSLVLLTALGGAFAFKAARFNNFPIWHYTDYVTSVANGKTYATYFIEGLCTRTGATLFTTPQAAAGFTSNVLTTAVSVPPITVQGTATDGSGFTTSILTYSCPVTVNTKVTTLE